MPGRVQNRHYKSRPRSSRAHRQQMVSAPSPGWPRQSWIAIEQATWVSSGLLLHGFSADIMPYQMLNTGYVRFSLSHIPATQRLRFVPIWSDSRLLAFAQLSDLSNIEQRLCTRRCILVLSWPWPRHLPVTESIALPIPVCFFITTQTKTFFELMALVAF